MSEKEMINHYKSIVSESQELEKALYDVCDFSFADMYVVKNGEDWLDCGKSDYKIEVFGNDASGGGMVNTQNEKVEEKHKVLLNQFLQDNEMETEPEKVYSMFVSAVIVEPEFIIEPTLPGYDRLDSLFAFNKDKYLKELRKKYF